MSSNLWNKLKAGTKELADRTNDAIETGRTKLEITSLKRRIDKCHRDLGKMVAKAYDQEETAFDLTKVSVKVIMTEIADHRKEIERLQALLKAEESTEDGAA